MQEEVITLKQEDNTGGQEIGTKALQPPLPELKTGLTHKKGDMPRFLQSYQVKWLNHSRTPDPQIADHELDTVLDKISSKVLSLRMLHSLLKQMLLRSSAH
jgi:hypothetical protein